MGDDDYVLGTRDDEIARLGLQHRVWRERVFEAWRRAGIGSGQTVVDVGAGPGWATRDLAELVGPQGRVIAVERSRHFLAAVERLGFANVETLARDVCAEPFGEAVADAAWCRWLLSFVADPEQAVAHIARTLKPGGTAVFHEYALYDGWRMMPPSAELDRFRSLVMQSWRDGGGEPDIGLRLPSMLEAAGFEIEELRPLAGIAGRGDLLWEWPAAFLATNARRLAELGYADAEEAEGFTTLLDRAPASARMVMPLVVEVIARRRG